MIIWAIIGMVLVMTMLFMGVLWVTARLLDRLPVSTGVTGISILLVCCAYTAYVTWAITSGNIPFLSGG